MKSEHLPAPVRRALAEAGLTLGVPMGRSLAPSAPRRALDAQGEHVVIRVIDIPESAQGAAVLRRLADLRSLRHPGLVPIREVLSLPGNQAAVIMEFIDGVSLDVVLGARGRLTSGQLAGLLDVLGSALAHMHERGSVHGDVSVGNVVIRLDGSPVFVDLLGSFMESGTEGFAAPERLAGGPATAAADVYALAAVLSECAGSSSTAARRVARVLGGALDASPQKRPGARDLVARAPELGSPSPIEMPDGARLAAGSLRAAARTPTRTVDSRRRRAKRGEAVVALSYGGSRPERGGWGGRAPLRRRLTRVGLAVVVAGACWLAFNPGALGYFQRMWPLNTAVAARSAAPSGQAGEDTSQDTAAPAGPTATHSASGAPTHSASASGEGSDAAEPAASASAGDSASGEPGRAGVLDDPQADMTAVVLALSRQRDQALMDADAQALSLTTVAGSPAAARDSQILAGLSASGDSVTGLHTSISAVTEVAVPAQAAATWPGAKAVQVIHSQGPYTRTSVDGERTVPAQGSRQLVLVLVPEPWRVAEVYTP